MNQLQNKARALSAVSAKHQCDFTTLFEKHFDRLLRKTGHYVKDLEAAKDIVQSTFAKVWDKQSHLEHIDNMRAYLEKACINGALNYLRDRRRFAGGALQQSVVGESESPYGILTYTEMHGSVMNFIHNFPDRMRAAFLLSRFQNMSYKEIAKNLGVSVVVVEKTMMKALKQVREFISRSGLRLFLFFALSSELKVPKGTMVQQPVTPASLVRRSGN
jgi:RNA polymerase sigma-70 factor (ECF subfamily)